MDIKVIGDIELIIPKDLKPHQGDIKKYLRNHPYGKNIFLMTGYTGIFRQQEAEIKELFENYGLNLIIAKDKSHTGDLKNPLFCALCSNYGILLIDDLFIPNAAFEFGFMRRSIPKKNLKVIKEYRVDIDKKFSDIKDYIRSDFKLQKPYTLIRALQGWIEENFFDSDATLLKKHNISFEMGGAKWRFMTGKGVKAHNSNPKARDKFTGSGISKFELNSQIMKERFLSNKALMFENAKRGFWSGCWQDFDFNEPTNKIIFGGWSKCKGVKGNYEPRQHYAIHIEIREPEQSKWTGCSAAFPLRENYWNFSCNSLSHKEGIKKIRMWILFRKFVGKVWFDEIFIHGIN